jgi:hypothetical protein
MDIFTFYLMLVKFSEFPVKDEEKSDRIFKNLFDEYEAQYDLDYCIWEAIFIHREITLIYMLTFVPQKKGLSRDGRKLSYGTP